MDLYGQVANTYSNELQNGVRLQAGLDQQLAQQPATLFDRFMNTYQQEYQRRRMEADMARKQAHEDYLLNKDKAAQLNSITDDISSQYTGDPAQKEMFRQRLLQQGVDPAKVDALLPRDRVVQEPGTIAPHGQTVGQIDGQDIYLPQTEADITPGKTRVIQGIGSQYALKQRVEESKADHRLANEQLKSDAMDLTRWLAENPNLAKNQFVVARTQEAIARQKELQMAIDAGLPQAQVELKKAQAKAAMANATGGEGMDPDTAAWWSQAVASGVPMPNMRRNPAQAKLMAGIASSGVSPQEYAHNQAAYGANKVSYNNLQKQYDAVSAFEGMAVRNIEALKDLTDKIPDMGSPKANQLWRSAQNNIAGSPAITNWNAQRATTLTEIARVVNNPNMTGVLHESARQEIENLLSPGATKAQVQQALDVFKAEMARRKDELQRQIGEIGGRITSVNPGAGVPGAAPPSPKDAERQRAQRALSATTDPEKQQQIRNLYKQNTGEDL